MNRLEHESYQQLLIAWKLYVSARGFKPNTQSAHVQCIEEFLEWLEEHSIYMLRDIDSKDLWRHWEYLQYRPNQRRSGGLSASVLNFHIYSLRTFFGWLQNLEAISINPMTGLEFPRQFSSPRVALEQEEIKRMYEVTETSKEKAILTVFYALGLRRSEAEALNLSEINFGLKRVIVKTGKFGKRRELPLHPKAEVMLREYITTERRDVIIAKTPKDHQVLFYNSIGLRMKGAKMNESIKRLAERAEITKPVSLHVLRHSVATHLKENGMPLEQIKDYLGHSSLDVTQNYVQGYGWKWNQKQRSKHGNND